MTRPPSKHAKVNTDSYHVLLLLYILLLKRISHIHLWGTILFLTCKCKCRTVFNFFSLCDQFDQFNTKLPPSSAEERLSPQVVLENVLERVPCLRPPEPLQHLRDKHGFPLPVTRGLGSPAGTAHKHLSVYHKLHLNFRRLIRDWGQWSYPFSFLRQKPNSRMIFCWFL